jgi:hypothetical protein
MIEKNRESQPEYIQKILWWISVVGITGSLLALIPQTQNLIIIFGEKFITHRTLTAPIWHERFFHWSLSVLLASIMLMITSSRRLEITVKKYGPSAAIIVSSIIVLASIVVRIIMYTKVRTLWSDEAALAENIITRNFYELLASPLINLQTAPAFYLYMVKTIGIIFGYTEASLRAFSFLMLLGVLAIEFILLQKVLKLNRVLIFFAIALTAIHPLYMYYSNELKPYMGDAFFILAVLLIYHLFINGKLKPAALVILYCAILLFSSPALFFITSVFIVEFIDALLDKKWQYIRTLVISGIIIMVFFLVYYILWLMPVAENDEMINFWEEQRFIFLAFNIGKIKNNIKIIFNMAKGSIFYIPFATVGFVVSLRNKNKLAFSIGVAILLLLVASNMGKYPISSRLWLFLPALIIMYMAVCFDFFGSLQPSAFKTAAKCIIVFLTVFFMMLDGNFVKSAGKELYRDTQEANPLIEYVRKNIEDDEYFYVYHDTDRIVKFKNGYTSRRIGNVEHDNIIYGETEWDADLSSKCIDEINKILNAKKVWLIFTHFYSLERIESGLNKLREHGTVEEAMNKQGTPLYHFTADKADMSNILGGTS